MPTLLSTLDVVEDTKQFPIPLWRGPEVDGITQSLLSRFLVCRERFRLRVVEGLSTQDQFNKNIEYGSMWHECEEALAKEIPWASALNRYCKRLGQRYPLAQEQIHKWYRVCLIQFPLYVSYHGKKDRKKRDWFLAEETFAVPYSLPDGRSVLLRGKWDGGFIQSRKRKLRENKTKGQIIEQQLLGQLQFDLQTMTYLTAYNLSDDHPKKIHDIEYNVVRRPLSGGKGTIRPHKATKNKAAETDDAFYRRLKEIIAGDSDYYFMRWDVHVSDEDLQRFQDEFLTPVLTQLCDWWQWIRYCLKDGRGEPRNPFTCKDNLRVHLLSSEQKTGRRISINSSIHWRHPFGVWNVLNEGGSSELDEYLVTGSEVGLERGRSLFPELEDE